MSKLDSKVPGGPLKDKWTTYKDNINLVDWLRQWAQTEEEREEVFLRGFLGKMLFSREEGLKYREIAEKLNISIKNSLKINFELEIPIDKVNKYKELKIKKIRLTIDNIRFTIEFKKLYKMPYITIDSYKDIKV